MVESNKNQVTSNNKSPTADKPGEQMEFISGFLRLCAPPGRSLGPNTKEQAGRSTVHLTFSSASAGLAILRPSGLPPHASCLFPFFRHVGPPPT
jgi:hypothetical protein